MGTRKRREDRQTRGALRRRWLVAGAGAAVVVVAAAWFLARPDASGAGNAAEGAPISAYRPRDMHALAVSPADERTVTFGHHNGMLLSGDSGASWKPVSGGAGKDAMGLAIPPGTKTAYAAGHGVFLRSDDGGQSWSSARPALPGTDIHGFSSSATRPGVFYAFVVGFGLYVSEDAGATWRSIGQAPGSTMSLAAAKSGSSDVLFASTMDQGVVRSRDGGRSWERVPELAGGGFVGAVGEIVYVASGPSVFVSRDGGLTWQNRAFPRGGAALVAAAPTNTSVVYVLTERFEVWRSRDAGVNWERAS